MIKVWDGFVRLFHWALVGAVAVAFITRDDRLELHVAAGYTVSGLVALRILWGLVGARHAQFRDFLFGPAVVAGYVRDLLRFRAARYLGHGPAGGAMVVALLISLVLTVTSGLAVYAGQEYAGALTSIMAARGDAWSARAETAHELCAAVTLALIGIHVAGVVFSSLAHRENLMWAMVTGYKRSRDGAATKARVRGTAHHAGRNERMMSR